MPPHALESQRTRRVDENAARRAHPLVRAHDAQVEWPSGAVEGVVQAVDLRAKDTLKLGRVRCEVVVALVVVEVGVGEVGHCVAVFVVPLGDLPGLLAREIVVDQPRDRRAPLVKDALELPGMYPGVVSSAVAFIGDQLVVLLPVVLRRRARIPSHVHVARLHQADEAHPGAPDPDRERHVVDLVGAGPLDSQP